MEASFVNDLPLEQLKSYKPERAEPVDFRSFWETTLEGARAFPLEPQFELVETGLNQLDVFDVTFNGFGGQAIKSWLIMPRQRTGKLPCVVEYIGYGAGRDKPSNWLLWASVGYAHFVMDNRGQGGDGFRGDTVDRELDGSEPENSGFIIRGIRKPETYYYRRLFTDAVRAVEAARSHPSIDPLHVAIDGSSQGGGISLAVSGLVPDLDAIIIAVPALCHYRRAAEISTTDPYNEIRRYLKNQDEKTESAFATLDYFDGLNFAAYARAPALFSVGMLDETCVPSTVFAVYNHYAGEKDIRTYQSNHWGCGGSDWIMEKVKYLGKIWK